MKFAVFTRPTVCMRMVRHFFNHPFDLFHIARMYFSMFSHLCSISVYRQSYVIRSISMTMTLHVHTCWIYLYLCLWMRIYVRTFPCLSCSCGISYRFSCAIRLTICNTSVLLLLVCVLSFLNLFASLSLSLSLHSSFLFFFFDHPYLLAHFTLHHFHIHSIQSTYVFMWMCIWYDAVYIFF